MTHTRSALFCLIVAAALAACAKQPAQNAQREGSGGTPAASAPEMAPSHASATAPAERAPAGVPAQAGPVTSIADIWTNRTGLAGKTVTVHGKVVKFNGGILGRNWLHVQDGTGKAEDKTNDLTITTTDEAEIGDEVTVAGTVGVDRDFTAGYAYPVMLENARIFKK